MMHTDAVEIYSDETNRAVLRHPGRKYPGVLLQGDTLHALCAFADAACGEVRRLGNEAAFRELNALRDQLWSFLNHYKAVLGEHNMRLPVSEMPRS